MTARGLDNLPSNNVPSAQESVDVMLRIIVCGVALMIATQVHAQNASGSAANYPNRPVKVIVPFAPGGVTDVIARLWAQRMSSNLGQQFYVENHAG
jgi:tripartite-type tricarboxylate transporter receptor subunit TctC